MLRWAKYAAVILTITVLLTLFSFPVTAARLSGDVNGDSHINATDATRVLLHAVGKSVLTGDALEAADVNDDGKVNSLDAARILLHAVGKITIDDPDKPAVVYKALTSDDMLSVDGTHLKNRRGERVVLQGTNLGGWLHLEGWLDGGGTSDWNDYPLRTTLISRFGEKETDALLDVYQDAYITRRDLEDIRAIGLNLVRVPIYWMELMDNNGHMKSGAFKQLDWLVENCRELGLYVILDLHGTPGGHSAGFSTGGQTGSNEFWQSTLYQDWVNNIWYNIADHYSGEPTIAGYELLNEPAQFVTSNSIIPRVCDRLYRTIRMVDSDHIVVMCAGYEKHYDSDFKVDVQNFNDVSLLGSPTARGWENVMYDTHHYLPEKKDGDSQEMFAAQQLELIRTAQEKYNVPILAGEFNFWTAQTALQTWLCSLYGMGVSYSTWTYKNTDTNISNNWGLYYRPHGISRVNFKTDSYETIATKWKTYTTANYTANTYLTGMLSKNIDPMGSDTGLSRSRWIVKAYKTAQGELTEHLIDGDLTTRWSNGEAQRLDGSQWVQIDMTESHTIARLTMFTPNRDTATEFTVQVSADGDRWTQVAEGVGAIGRTEVTFQPVSARYIRITQTGAMDNHYWSIYDLRLFSE